MRLTCSTHANSEEANRQYNMSQHSVGSALKTLKGSKIQRCAKYGVGKLIGGDIYVHKQYAEDVVPEDIWDQAVAILSEQCPNFSYNCIRYSPDSKVVSFQESPDFDSAREPIVGEYRTVYTQEGVVKKGRSDYIWHHKWLWVKNDYTGFDVAESWNWSRRWLSLLPERSDGNGRNRWDAQLRRFGVSSSTDVSERAEGHITGASSTSTSTTFYEITLDEASNILADNGLNLFSQYALDTNGWDCIDLHNHLFGSFVDGDTLYLCVTDGQPIFIDGQEVDPEKALSEFGPENCEEYIRAATEDVILRHISEHEITTLDLDESARDLMKQGYTFTQLHEAATELDEL